VLRRMNGHPVAVGARHMSQPDASFEVLLLHLKENRGFDFTGYKRSSLTRRVNGRMAQVGITDYIQYLEYLELHIEEFTALFNTILINVTSFFGIPRPGSTCARRSCRACWPPRRRTA
jgi:hypothetical protein